MGPDHEARFPVHLSIDDQRETLSSQKNQVPSFIYRSGSSFERPIRR